MTIDEKRMNEINETLMGIAEEFLDSDNSFICVTGIKASANHSIQALIRGKSDISSAIVAKLVEENNDWKSLFFLALYKACINSEECLNITMGLLQQVQLDQDEKTKENRKGSTLTIKKNDAR